MTRLSTCFRHVNIIAHTYIKNESKADVLHLAFSYVANEKDGLLYYLIGTMYGKKAETIKGFLDSAKKLPPFFVKSDNTFLAVISPKNDDAQFLNEDIVDQLGDLLDPYYAVPYFQSIEMLFPIAPSLTPENSAMAVGTCWEAPSMTYLTDGKQLCKGQITCSTNRKKVKSYLRYTAWDKTAETMADYIKAKDTTNLVGSFQFRTYENKDEETKVSVDMSVTNVKLMFTPREAREEKVDSWATASTEVSGYPEPGEGEETGASVAEEWDEVPF